MKKKVQFQKNPTPPKNFVPRKEKIFTLIFIYEKVSFRIMIRQGNRINSGILAMYYLDIYLDTTQF